MVKVLVPIDLAADEKSRESVVDKAIAAVADDSDGKLVFLTVVPEFNPGVDWRYSIRGETGGSEDFDTKKMVEEAVEKLREVIAPKIEQEEKLQVEDVELIARYGKVYVEILDVASELSVDEIIMSAHQAFLSGYLIGSNTARVVRHAPCTVMVVR